MTKKKITLKPEAKVIKRFSSQLTHVKLSLMFVGRSRPYPQTLEYDLATKAKHSRVLSPFSSYEENPF